MGGSCVVRKHGLDGALHGDYRRETFHCEPALQSLQEIEGENAAGERGALGSPEDSPTPTPTPTLTIGTAVLMDDLTLKPSRRLGRQESPLSRDSFLTGREKTVSELQATRADTKGTFGKEVSSTALQTDQAKVNPAEKGQFNQAATATPSAVLCKGSPENQAPSLSSSSTAATSSSPSSSSGGKISEKSPGPLVTPTTSPLALEQNQHGGQKAISSSSTTQGVDKCKSFGKAVQAQDRGVALKAPVPEVTKSSKGLETGGKDGSSLKEGIVPSEKPLESKTKGPGPPCSDPSPVTAKPKESKVSGLVQRNAREEKRLLEVVEEHPASPSPTALSPSSSKSRAASPGDKASFVTQLTSVAKTVLGPMKLGSQDGGKTKDGSAKTNDEKKGGSSGKSDSSYGSRRGATGTWPGPSGSSKTDKAKSSSKNH